MTPSKNGKVTSIKFEKVKRTQIDESRVAHKAGGQHAGLVINKQTAGLSFKHLYHNDIDNNNNTVLFIAVYDDTVPNFYYHF